jgi:hypothetical protein
VTGASSAEQVDARCSARWRRRASPTVTS